MLMIYRRPTVGRLASASLFKYRCDYSCFPGILLWLMDAWNINVSAGVISLAVSFSRRPGILSGPIALCGFKLVKSFMTPLWWIIIDDISGVELTLISGMLLRSSDIKTDEN
jgi:hypothetical protein